MAKPQPFNASDIKRRMTGAVDALKHDFGGLRTGRASTSLLEPLQVDAYGAMMPINQVASISVPEPRMLQISVWDRGLVIAVEKSIRASNLGLNPATEGQVIRLRMPDLTQDRRKELVKVAHQYAEKGRVAVRNVRRDGMDQLKALEKEHMISEDEQKSKADEVQKMTDDTIKEIDTALKGKEAEIMQV
ncbi:ribosome recycling factor [Aestuariivirga sp.]|uniref:ribosome recycling factor n=1 Tax=Aestuariivirga sp. TaxID=2650926 RepID=UPI0039E312B4